jgi:hypothetical protein
MSFPVVFCCGKIRSFEKWRVKMNADKVKEIEERIADLKARWPAHSVKPSMWQELEDLEEELKKAREET